MAIRRSTAADVAHWRKRVAELERELEAATKLSEVREIAGELRRTKAALKAEVRRAGKRPRQDS